MIILKSELFKKCHHCGSKFTKIKTVQHSYMVNYCKKCAENHEKLRNDANEKRMNCIKQAIESFQEWTRKNREYREQTIPFEKYISQNKEPPDKIAENKQEKRKFIFKTSKK